MTEQDKKDIIGMIRAYKDVYKYHCDHCGNVFAVRMDAGCITFTTPEEVRQDILEYLYGIPKGAL